MSRPSASAGLPTLELGQRLAGIGLLCVGLLAALWALPTRAAEASGDAQEAPAATVAAGTRYTTRAGDTLERIVQQNWRDSPLQPAVLVRQLQAHNALLIGEVGPRQRLKSGLLLELPSHEQLVRKVLSPYLAAEEAQRTAATATEVPRKRWVRYP